MSDKKNPRCYPPFSLIDIAINFIPKLYKAIGTTPMMDNHPPDSVPAGSDPHQDDALDADRGAGELTVKSSLRQGLYCRHDNQCGSGQMCDAVSANYVSVSIL